MKSKRYQKIGVLVLGALGLFFTIGVAAPASAGMTAILMKGGKTSEIQNAEMVFRYKDTRGYMLGGVEVERAFLKLPIIINNIEKQSIPLNMIEEIRLKSAKRPHAEEKNLTVRYLDAELKLSNGKISRGEIGTYLPLPKEGDKKAADAYPTNIHDILVVGTSSSTGLRTEVSLYDVSQIVLQHK